MSDPISLRAAEIERAVTPACLGSLKRHMEPACAACAFGAACGQQSNDDAQATMLEAGIEAAVYLFSMLGEQQVTPARVPHYSEPVPLPEPEWVPPLGTTGSAISGHSVIEVLKVAKAKEDVLTAEDVAETMAAAQGLNLTKRTAGKIQRIQGLVRAELEALVADGLAEKFVYNGITFYEAA